MPLSRQIRMKRAGDNVVMSPLSEDELEAMLARAQSALPGPWWASWEGRDHESGDSFIGTGVEDARGVDIYVTTDDGPAGQADLDFIARARQDVPALVSEIRRLRATVQDPDHR
jgi:hypothetical protein